MNTDYNKLYRICKDRFSLDIDGIHGKHHWWSVRIIGLQIAKINGADINFIKTFALLHDCCRENDERDKKHAERAAEFAKSLWNKVVFLDGFEFYLLAEALSGHNKKNNRSRTSCLEVHTCWDADRLNLPRLGVKIKPEYLCTDAARQIAQNF